MNRFFILCLLAFGCENSFKKESKKPFDERNQIENIKFFVGDIDNNQINDTAFVVLKPKVIGNVDANDNVLIKFSKDVPEISFDNSLGVYIKSIEDLNNDGANEILVFSRTNEGWWNYISVWSFKNGLWNEIGKTKAFIAEDKDFENRIIKEQNIYYLVGDDQWNEDEKGAFLKTKVKL
jgi:hypothetical protein